MLRRRSDPGWRGQERAGDLWSGGGRAYAAWMRPGPRRRRAPLIVAIALLSVFAGAALAGPTLLTGAGDACTALETAVLRHGSATVPGAGHGSRWPRPVADREGRSRSGGEAGRRVATLEYPSFPSAAACLLLFWQVQAGR